MRVMPLLLGALGCAAGDGASSTVPPVPAATQVGGEGTEDTSEQDWVLLPDADAADIHVDSQVFVGTWGDPASLLVELDGGAEATTEVWPASDHGVVVISPQLPLAPDTEHTVAVWRDDGHDPLRHRFATGSGTAPQAGSIALESVSADPFLHGSRLLTVDAAIVIEAASLVLLQEGECADPTEGILDLVVVPSSGDISFRVRDTSEVGDNTGCVCARIVDAAGRTGASDTSCP